MRFERRCVRRFKLMRETILKKSGAPRVSLAIIQTI